MPRSAPRPRSLIRIVVVDRHPAYRFGVDALLKAEPDLAVVGTAGDLYAAWHLLRRVDPDVVLIDDDPAAGRHVSAALQLRGLTRAHVVVCSAEATPQLGIAARLAGAAAVVDKGAAPEHLLEVLRGVGSGELSAPPVTLRAQGEAAALLPPADRPILAMRLAGTSLADMAAVCHKSARGVSARLEAIVDRLAARGPMLEAAA